MFVLLPKFLVPSLAILTAVCISLSVWFSINGSNVALAQDAAPAQPTGLSVSSQDFQSVTIAWDDPQDDSITSYQILRRSRDGDTYGDGQGAWEFVAVEDDTGTADTVYTDGTATPQTRYVYRVKARNPAGLSERSSYANAETLGPPDQPTGLTVSSASHDSVTIAWGDPQDASISGYQVLRRSRDGDTYGDGQGAWDFVAIENDTGSSDAEYTDQSVTAETRYVYRVKARNPAGLSERSSYANAETPAAPESTPQPTPAPTPKPPLEENQAEQQQEATTKDTQGSELTSRQQQQQSEVALDSLTVDGTGLPGVSAERTTYEFGMNSTVNRATIAVTTDPAGATVTYSPEDADPIAAGHQVNLSSGANTITITAGPFQQGDILHTAKQYTLNINRGVSDDFGWKAEDDIDTLVAADNLNPTGIWSDGTNIWVADGDDLKLYAYQLSTGERDSGRDIDLDSENAAPKGIWSDEETIWVVDSADRGLYAYTLESGARDSVKDFTNLGDNDAVYYGIWSDGETIWLSDETGPVVEAFDFDTGEKVPALRYTELEPSGQDHVAGIWSDGATMWVANPDRGMIVAFEDTESQANLDKSFETLTGAGNASAGGIWSDGETMWVADSDDGKIYSYNLPASDNTDLSSITLDGMEVPGVAPGATAFVYRVPNSTSRITLAATARHSGSTVYYHPQDADDITGGHQVDLGVGSNDFTITVVAQDGITTTYHTLTVNRASTSTADWAVMTDLEDVLGSGSEFPGGIWSDGTYIWASGGDDLKLYAYKLATGEHESDRDISLHSDNGDPQGIWSNGTTMWVLDNTDRKLYAYTLGSGDRDSARDFGVFGDGDDDYYGVWSDGRTVWISNVNGYKVEAFNFSTGEAKPDLNYEYLEPSAQDHTAGIWSDGVTMWVVDPVRNVIVAYDSPESEFNQQRGFRRLNAAGNTNPRDIWSDGETMWVSDGEDGKIYSYNMPDSNNVELRSIYAAGRFLSGFEPDTHSYTLGHSNHVGQVIVQGFPRQRFATVSYTPEDSAPNLGGHQVDLNPGVNPVTITVLAQDGVTQGTYTVNFNRGSSEDFEWNAAADLDTLNRAGNESPGGLVSDGSTMWVADEVELKLYAYDLRREARTPDLDITLDPEQGSPGGLWSDGTTIWAYDVEDRKLYAYLAETGERDESKDIDGPEDTFPHHYGVWSNGDTLWLSQRTGGLAAYDLATGARDEDRDFDALDGVDGIDARGIWSDGVTMWVVDSAHDRVRALNVLTGEPDTGKDIQTPSNGQTGSTRGIWSDGQFMWVSDSVAGKVYSYNMPALDSTYLREVLVDGMEAAGSTVDSTWYATVASTDTEATIAATAAQLKATATLGGIDSDEVADGHQLAIPDLTANLTITVTAHNGDTREHALTVSRVNTASAPVVRVFNSATGDIASPEEFDVVAVDLVTDELYRFEVEGVDNGDGALANPRLLGLFKLVYGTAVPVGNTDDFLGGHGTNSSEVYHEPKPEGQGPATRATYYIVVGSENRAAGGYRLSVDYEDEATADTSTTATTEVLPSSYTSGKRGRYHFRGAIGEPGDRDWIKVTLEADQMYGIVIKSATTGNYRTLSEPILGGLYTDDDPENYIRGTLTIPSGNRFEPRLHYYAKSSGVYYISAMGFGDKVGAYDLLVMEQEDDCQPDNTSTHDTIAVGESKDARIDYRGDTDWFRVNLTGGTTYRAEVASRGERNPLPFPKVYIHNGSGQMVSSGTFNSEGPTSVASITPTSSGTYYIVASSMINRSGLYTVSLSEE